MPGHPGSVNRNSGSEARHRGLTRDQAAGWSMRVERQRAYDNDFWGGVSDGLWDSTVGFAGTVWDNGVLVATNLDKLPEVGVRTAGGVGDLASATVNTGVEIATHFDMVPERTASLAAEIDQGTQATLAAIQSMNPRQWGYVCGTGVGIAGIAVVGGVAPGGARALISGVRAAAGRAATTTAASSALVPYDAAFAARQFLGTSVTPGGRTITAHAAEQIATSGRGIGVADVDRILDSAVRVVYDPVRAIGPTIRVFEASGRSVVVDAATGTRIVTVIP